MLLTYLATHFSNHALGLISLDAMEAGRAWFVGFWRNPLATIALYGSLIIHLALAFYALYRRQRHAQMESCFWRERSVTGDKDSGPAVVGRMGLWRSDLCNRYRRHRECSRGK